MKTKSKFKVGDKVVLKGNPYDEQIPEEMEKYCRYKNTICTVKEVGVGDKAGDYEGWGYGYIRVTVHGWISDYWFKKLKVQPCPHCQGTKFIPSPDPQTQVKQLIQFAKDNGYGLAVEWMEKRK